MMQRPDPMIPCKPGAEDIVCMANRQKWIETLYRFDGRHDKAHPQHGHYTGLALKYQQLDSVNGET
tara:strand:+ start:51 stop:248 length:198 start_codon:yes stop_codon:yes gene_type:complete